VSTRRKDKLVDTIKDRDTGVEVKVFLTPDDSFKAVYLEAVFKMGSMGELRTELLKFIHENAKLEWIPVIEVEANDTDERHDHEISLKAERFLVARKHDGRYLRHDWIAPGEELDVRYASEYYVYGTQGLVLPTFRSHAFGENLYALKYDEATWAGLEKLQDAIKRLRDQLSELIGTEEGRQRIGEVGAALLLALPAPKEE